MSRSWTPEECREIGQVLKARGILLFDYDKFCQKIDSGEIVIEMEEVARSKET